MARTRHDQPAILVTTAGQSPQEDRRDRERRYLFLMGLRVIAIIAAIAIGRVAHLGALVAVLVVAAMVLPWVAVVIANAGPRRSGPESPSLWSPHRRRLSAGDTSATTAAGSTTDGVTGAPGGQPPRKDAA